MHLHQAARLTAAARPPAAGESGLGRGGASRGSAVREPSGPGALTPTTTLPLPTDLPSSERRRPARAVGPHPAP